MTPITSGRVKLAEHARNAHVVVLPKGMTIDDAKDPAIWAHVTGKIKPRDRMELWAEDRAWFADVVVFEASVHSVKFAVLTHIVLDTVALRPGASTAMSGYHVDFGGPVDQYRVIRDADSQLMTQGLSASEAQQWIIDHVASQNGAAAAQPFAGIPDGWETLHWKKQVAIAEGLNGGPLTVDEGQSVAEKAKAVILAALVKEAA
jgi:hypothetical protein